jgi:hypothetical protein
LKGYGTFDGNIYLDTSPVILYAQTGPTMSGYLHSYKTTRITDVYGQYLEFSPDGVQDVNITGLRLGESVSWIATSASSVNFTVSGLQDGMQYNVMMDGTRIESLESIGGTITFTYSGPWSSHEFLVIVSSTHQVSILGALIGLFIILGVFVSVIAVAVHATREKRMLTVKDAFMMVIFVVIGIAVLSVIYTLLP